MSDWSDLYNKSATLKRRLEATLDNGAPIRAFDEIATVNCRIFGQRSQSNPSGDDFQITDIYADVDSNTSQLKIGDFLTISSIDYQIRSIRDIAGNGEVYHFETFRSNQSDVLI